MDSCTHEVRAANWKAVAAQCQSRPKGQTIAEWCKQNDIKPNTHYYWQRRARKQLYVVYFCYCGTGSQKPLMTVKGAKNTTVKIKKFGGKKNNRKRSYTLWVVAKKGKKVLKTSAEIHVAGSKRKDETNAASVSVKKSRVTLKKNKTSAIAATVKKAGKGKLHKSSKIPRIRYSTSNRRVATVNKKGVIKAVGKGKCKIRATALNGVCTYVTVK